MEATHRITSHLLETRTARSVMSMTFLQGRYRPARGDGYRLIRRDWAQSIWRIRRAGTAMLTSWAIRLDM